MSMRCGDGLVWKETKDESFFVKLSLDFWKQFFKFLSQLKKSGIQGSPWN